MGILCHCMAGSVSLVKPLLELEALGHLQRDFDRELADRLGGGSLISKKEKSYSGAPTSTSPQAA